MQTDWDEKYLTQVDYFYHINMEWKVPHSGETSHLGEMSHFGNPQISVLLRSHVFIK